MKRLILVDGNALLHRAYHATPPLTTSNGELINAVFGFSAMLLKALSDLDPDYIVVAWDEKGPTFRHQAYTQYKATRGPSDDGLTTQYPRVHQIVEVLNIPEFKLSGYEADDLIGTLAKQAVAKMKNLEVIILTGDRDIMQLIEERIRVLMPKKTLSDIGLYGLVEFREKYGFEPINLIDYKALAGDASDNIPGVAGIGDVSATKLIKQFKLVEEIYKPQNLETLPQRMQQLLGEGAESAVMSKTLATIDIKAPIKLDLSKCVVKNFDQKKAIALFEEVEFKSLINRIPGVDDSLENNTKNIDDSSTQQQGQPKNQFTLELDLEVEKVLQKMSQTGIRIDLGFLNKLGSDLKSRLGDLEHEIYQSIGHEFNINSPKQLSEILFDEIKLPVYRKTKTGRSTDEETLRELEAAHPVISLLIEYRQIFKLISTYIDALPKYPDEGGRIHSTFNVEGAATGRLSSKDPNLQNIPIRGEKGSEIRRAFLATKGKVLLGADYSQIELRVVAHLADDPGFKQAFLEEVDIHSLTASKIFNLPIDQVNKEQRAAGKTLNFAILYGQGSRATSRQLKIDVTKAKEYIEAYFNQFPKVREWMAKVLEEGYKNGYVETIWGRRRYIPELQAGNRAVKAFGERAAINHPVQGTAADMIKKAMVEIDKNLSSSCQLILQVHDELLFECDPKTVNDNAKMIKEKMENSLKLSVPVKVELKVGKNWGEMTPLDIN